MIIKLLIELVLGGVAGYLAAGIMKADQSNMIMNVILGIVGGIVGGFIGNILGIGGGWISGLILAIGGACLHLRALRRRQRRIQQGRGITSHLPNMRRGGQWPPIFYCQNTPGNTLVSPIPAIPESRFAPTA